MKDVSELLLNDIDFECWADDAEINGGVFRAEDSVPQGSAFVVRVPADAS